jgi:1,4-dihydroxy-2-naphthoate octaprenyltransferase
METTHATAQAVTRIAGGLAHLSDPALLVAPLVSVGVGTALALQDSLTVDLRLAALAVATLFFIELGRSSLAALYDFYSGCDDPRTRRIADGSITESEITATATLSLALAGILGVSFALATHLFLLVAGIGGALIALALATPPMKLAWRGLGETLAAMIYGPAVVIGAEVALGGTATSSSAMIATSLGLLLGAVVITGELRTVAQNRAAGKNTLVVLLGEDTVIWLLGAVLFLAFALPMVMAASRPAPHLLALLAGLPVALWGVGSSMRADGRGLIGAEIAMNAAFVLSGTAAMITLLLNR